MKKTLKKNCYYKLISVNSGLAVEETVDGVRMKAPANEAAQLWKLTSEGKFLNKASGRCMDIQYGGNTNGCRIHTWEPLDNANSQLWLIDQDDEGRARITSVFAGKCLDVVGLSTLEGAEVQIWDKAEGPNQLWMLESGSAKKEPAEEKAEKAEKKAPKAKAAKAPKAEKAEEAEKPARKSRAKKAAEPAEEAAAPAEKKTRKPRAKKAAEEKAPAAEEAVKAE